MIASRSLSRTVIALLLSAGSPATVAMAGTASTRPAEVSAPLFDPTRHMRVSEVRPGMTGYGLTVFHGTKIERFEVEVVSILKNFNASSDVVLIRCKGDYLQHTGSIAGMSGSPVYLTDDAGHDRMIGAFAYGWPLTKDPVAGVQPIEYMLKLPLEKETASTVAIPATAPSAGANADVPRPRAGIRSAWSLKDAGMLPLSARGLKWSATALVSSRYPKHGQLLGGDSSPGMQPLATPLMTSGLPPAIFEALNAQFRAAGLTPLQSGIGGSGAADTAPAKLEPGSVLAVPLLTGDMEMTAIGTATEVIGDKVWGFGHPFNNEGPISLPMGSGQINGVIANLQTSFKLGSLTKTRGTLTTDASVGVAGIEGATPSTIPVDLQIESAAGGKPRAYHFNVSRHPKFTPLIVAAAFGGAVSGASELPQYNTVDYSLQLSFSNGQKVILANRAVNTSAADLFGDAATVIQAASENPFERVMVNQITGSVKIRAVAEAAQIVDVNLPRSHYHPGDRLKAFITYQPFHGVEGILPVELELPRDLPHGQYQVVISDAQRYFADEQQSKAFRFVAEDINDVFEVLRDVASIRENAVFVRLLRQSDGVAIGHTALARLPSSRREILLASGRSNTTAFVSSAVKMIPTDLVMTGASEFTIDVETASKVAVGVPRSVKADASAAAAKPEDPKKPASPVETPGKKETPGDSQK